MLVAKQFDTLTRNCLDSVLVQEEGFCFLNGIYYRDLPTRLRHVVIVDLEAKRRKDFRVIIGLNSAVLAEGVPADEAGVHVSRFVSEAGLSSSAQKFLCFSEAKAIESLKTVCRVLSKNGLPWLSQHSTLSDFANSLTEIDYDYLRGKLFFAEGEVKAARHEFQRYRRRLEEMPDSPRVQSAREEIDRYLSGGETEGKRG